MSSERSVTDLVSGGRLVSVDPLMCGVPALGGPSLAATPPIDGTSAWNRVREVLEAVDVERAPEALVLVESLRAMTPVLGDELDLMRARLQLLIGPASCDGLDAALASPLPRVEMEAKVAWVRCLLATGSRHAETELASLSRRYPELPDQVGLELARAQMHERAGRVRDAITAYDAIDQEHPGDPSAAIARARLAALSAAGERMPSRSPLEEVGRAGRLVRSGPPDLARIDVDRLLAARLPTAQAAEVRLLAARLARVEGRFDDARLLLRDARGMAPAVGEDPEAVAAVAADLEVAAARSADEARSELRAMGYGRGMRRTSATRLYMMARVAAHSGLTDELAVLLDEMITRSSGATPLSCVVREDTAIIAAGSADARVARLLDGCPSLTARYHRARALERFGARSAARDAYREVIATDDTDTHFYALWARTRIAAMRSPSAGSTANEAPEAAAPVLPSSDEVAVEAPLLDDVGFTFPAGEPLAIDAAIAAPITLTHHVPGPWSLAMLELGESKIGEPSPRRGPTLVVPSLHEAITAEGDVVSPDDDEPESLEPVLGHALSDAQVLETLANLAVEHEEGFPWFSRARARITLGDRAGAAEELFQAWAAWREANGSAPIRAGTEAVYRGAAPPRIATDLSTRRARRDLSARERDQLADVAAHLGDHGLAARFGGSGRVAMRPRPYEDLVRAAAERHHLDPNLIWAVMRVESVYNPSIVSYAGAIGLLQIMPRTGRLIANALHRPAFTTADLLDPATNIEFGAWYLRSLLDRFEGRIPLAVASYNGGPHNVRRWMAEYSDAMPVDALCERIPFTQTFRYVRRVLHHYAAYRDAEGLGLPELDPTLPGAAVDTVAF
jgi:soluble lytic murein transglycosylase